MIFRNINNEICWKKVKKNSEASYFNNLLAPNTSQCLISFSKFLNFINQLHISCVWSSYNSTKIYKLAIQKIGDRVLCLNLIVVILTQDGWSFCYKNE